MALRMYPFWILGLFMIFCTVQAGLKDLLRIDKQGIKSFLVFMVKITLFRIVLFKFFPHITNNMLGNVKNSLTIPLGGTAFVFWEDMAHTLPLLLMFRYLNDSLVSKIFKYAVLGLTMFVFGFGHTYQGIFAALALSFYIPFAIKLGESMGWELL